MESDHTDNPPKGNTASHTANKAIPTVNTAMFQQTKRKRRIFQAESKLTPNHTPDQLIGREEELDRIADGVRPLTRKKPADNLLIHGPAGVGKTSCVNHVFDRLADQTPVRTITINCWQYNTRSSLLSQLLIELGYPAPRKGKPVDELLLKLEEWIDKNSCVAIALEEFDQLEDQTEIVYDLQQLNNDTNNEIGLLLVSNQPPADLHLDARSESRLNYQPLHFQPYDTQDLFQILKERANQAFKPGTIADNTLKLIAEIAARDTSDCRQALSMLLRAGRTAQQANANKITPKHINQEPESPAA